VWRHHNPRPAIGARSKRVSLKRLRLGFVLLRFARAVVAFVSLDRSSEIAPRVALGYPRVAPSPARRASRARAHLKLNRKHGNVPPDQHDRRRGDAEDQLSVLRRADVVHALRVNVRLRASPRPRASSSSSVIPRRRVDVSSRASRVLARASLRALSRAVPPSPRSRSIASRAFARRRRTGSSAPPIAVLVVCKPRRAHALAARRPATALAANMILSSSSRVEL